MHSRVSFCARLSCPDLFSRGGWREMICDPTWPAYVQRLHFSGSILHRGSIPREPSIKRSDFECVVCGEQFPTSNCLLAHFRTRHRGHPSAKAAQRFYASAICFCCGTNFVQPIRLLKHLHDSRRTRCRTFLLVSSIQLLEEEPVQKFDLIDRQARTEAKRCGHSQPIARGIARKASGKQVGFARRVA